MAARSACAAANDASDRRSKWCIPGPVCAISGGFPARSDRKSGYADGQNVSIEYRWAEGEYDRLPRLASELVGRKVDVIAASGGDLAARAAKGATSTIPIVFTSGDDPTVTGLVASLARPGGNLTGVSFFVVELHAKRFELITELVPKAKIIALLVNPNSPQTERVLEAMRQTTRTKGVQLEVLKAATDIEIDTAFAALDQLHADLLIEQSDPFFVNRRQQFALLAARHAIPTIYEQRVFAQAGGLISYGPDIPDVYRQVGAYVGRILKGDMSLTFLCYSQRSLNGGEPYGRQSHWADYPRIIPAARRRGDRIKSRLCCTAEVR